MREYREADLAFYLPDYFKNIKEFQKIAELESEAINSLNEKCMNIWNDGFIATAGYQGIKKWESLLNIKPDSKLTLDERHAAVLTEWGRQLPYTESKLREQLTSMLGDDYELYILNDNYELKLVVIERSRPVVKSIQKMVKEMIPANLMAGFFSKYKNKYVVPVSERNSIRFCTAFYPRCNLPHLLLDNTWVLDGTRNLNGYNSDNLIDFYPVKFRFQSKVPETVYQRKQVRVFMDAKKQNVFSAEKFGFEAEVKENIRSVESIAFSSGAQERVAVGPIRITNMNVLDNTWELDGERLLDGGLSIL